jgi:hypothetical protein
MVMQGGKLSSFVMPVIRASFRSGKMLSIPMSNRPSLTYGKQGGKLAEEASFDIVMAVFSWGFPPRQYG